MEKEEIEKQIKEMLDQGVVNSSRSPFASPVLLVKKKGQSLRLNIDYNHLNNMTMKEKFPIPIIVNLLDELISASSFTKLDLWSKCYQI